ncbi:MAG: GAF domain-containing protein [Anaerolineales bacterium]|nr:GAF domain-containing protein [Anaerolineales bacterium]
MKKQNRLSAFRIAFIYLTAGILWILLTDTILLTTFREPGQLSTAQTYKGWFYVGATSLILYILLKINERRVANTKTKVQEEYRELVEQLPAVVFIDVFNDEQSTQYMSPRIKDLVGYTAKEWTKNGRDMWTTSLHPDDKERVLNEDKRTNQTGEAFRIEYRLRHRDGHYVWIKEDASLVKGEDGKPLFWQGILLDITEQKKAEEVSRHRDEVLRVSTMELTHYVDLNNLFEKIFSTLHKLIEYDSASIELINNGSVEIVAGKNIPKEMIGRQYQVNTKKWGGLDELREVKIIADVQSDERFVIFEETSYIRSWMGIPLMAQEKLIGFLNLDSRTPNYFNDEFAALAQTFANQAAIAIENTRLFELEKKRVETADMVRQAATALTNPLDLPSLYQAILEWLNKITPYDSASILEIEGDLIRLTAESGLPHPEKALNQYFSANDALLKAVKETAQTLIIDDCWDDTRFEKWGDTEHIRGWMGVPLISRGQVIGYITIDSKKPNAFTQNDAVAAQTFAQQAATSLENVRLYTETKQRLEELETVSRVSSALRAAQDTNEMFPILLREIETIMKTEMATIFLYDEESNALTSRASSKMLANIPKTTYKPGEGIIGHVYASGQPHTSFEFNIDPIAAPENAEFIGAGWGGIAVPIRTANEIIGVIIVGIKKPRHIEEDYVRLMTTIAEIAGNAIYRSNLFEKSENQIRRLTTLREIDTAITSSLDLRITLNIILEHLLTKMGVSAASFLIFNPDSQMLDSLAASGFQNQESTQASISIGDGLATQILLNRKSIHIKDLSNETNQDKTENFVSYYALPLFSKGTTRGVLEMYFKKTFTPNDDWIEFVQTLAGQATIAIDNAQLFENLQRSNQELSLAYDTTLEGWGKALELRDKETQGHTHRVTNLTLELAQRMGIPDSQLTHIRRGALLHDIGKMGVSDNILRKPGALTEDEMNEMRKHPKYAYELLYPIPYLRAAVDIPYCHHEWWDGNGYPRGLKGEEIPLAARIFAIVDVWDALLSDRPYRKAWNQKDTCKYILDLSGKQFDPRVVSEFQRILDMEPEIIQSNLPQSKS